MFISKRRRRRSFFSFQYSNQLSQKNQVDISVWLFFGNVGKFSLPEEGRLTVPLVCLHQNSFVVLVLAKLHHKLALLTAVLCLLGKKVLISNRVFLQSVSLRIVVPGCNVNKNWEKLHLYVSICSVALLSIMAYNRECFDHFPFLLRPHRPVLQYIAHPKLRYCLWPPMSPRK